KTQTDGAMPENAFQVSDASAAAKLFFWIQSHNGVTTFPHTFAPGIAPEANAVSEGPHANEFMKFAARRRDSGGHRIRVVENAHWRRGFSWRRGKRSLQSKSLHLMEIRRIFDHSISNDAWKSQAYCVNLLALCNRGDLLANAVANSFCRHRLERVQRSAALRVELDRADKLVVFDEPDRNVFHHQYADCFAHRGVTSIC